MIDRFRYEDGELFWVVGQREGRRAGCSRHDGYWVINSYGTVYLRHRIIWQMFNGPVPNGKFVDHINGDRSNDRLENLRLASMAESARNVGKHKDNKSGFKGVSPERNKWRATIWLNNRQMVVGHSHCPADCATMYNFAAAEFLEFARYNTCPQPWLEGELKF